MKIKKCKVCGGEVKIPTSRFEKREGEEIIFSIGRNSYGDPNPQYEIYLCDEHYTEFIKKYVGHD